VDAIRKGGNGFAYTLDWVSCFALAVQEENAGMGRVVAAPTNDSAGVVPAVLQYYLVFYNQSFQTDIFRFLLVAGAIGNWFGSAAAIAAAGLTELIGGTPPQALLAAEIAMENPAGDSALGAIKAITAAHLALKTSPAARALMPSYAVVGHSRKLSA
jgi:L-serine dehydratase